MIKINLKEDIVDKVENPSRRKFLKTAGKIAVGAGVIGLADLVFGAVNAHAQDNKTEVIENVSPHTYPQPKDFYDYSKKEIKNMSYFEVRELLDNHEKVEDYLLNYAKIRFKEDRGQHLQTPQETWEREKGDCEDFANLTRDILQHHNYEAGFFSVLMEYKGKRYAHTIGAFRGKDDGKWYFMQGYKDNRMNGKISKPYNNLEEMAKTIAKKNGGAKLLDHRIHHTEASYRNFFPEHD